VATERSPVRMLYRRESPSFAALRESLAAARYAAVSPPDALAEWEVRDGAGTRVRAWRGAVLVEATDRAHAEEFDRVFRRSLPSDGPIPDGGAAPAWIERVAASDESGKGERTGALAVAAVVVPMADEDAALEQGIRDSKECTRAEVVKLAEWTCARFPHEIRVIAASDREAALHACGGNESRLLADLHAECLAALCAREPFAFAVVDRFAPARPVAAQLARTHGAVVVDECVRGERHIACAAASILARNAVAGAR